MTVSLAAGTDIGTLLLALYGLYVLATIVFLISENRNPQATLAWTLAFLFVPGVGLLLYLFFGRDRKAFSKQGSLFKQTLEPRALPLLRPLLARQDAEIDRLESRGAAHRKLMRLAEYQARGAVSRFRDSVARLLSPLL